MKKPKKIFLIIASQAAKEQKFELEQLPGLQMIADLEPVFLFENPATDADVRVWIELARLIAGKINQADGFVVLHGIDNILYTASAVSFLIQNSKKPIIFTSYQSSGGDGKLEFKANLINALQAATYDLPEVCLMFGNQLIRANQAYRLMSDSLNMFGTKGQILGRIDFSIRLFERSIVKPAGKFMSYRKMNDNISVIEPSPFLDYRTLARELKDKDAVVVKADGCHFLPTELVKIFQKSQTLPIVIWSDQAGHFDLDQPNVLLVAKMTFETAVTKLMWSLCQAKKIKQIRSLMEKDIAKELSF